MVQPLRRSLAGAGAKSFTNGSAGANRLRMGADPKGKLQLALKLWIWINGRQFPRSKAETENFRSSFKMPSSLTPKALFSLTIGWISFASESSVSFFRFCRQLHFRSSQRRASTGVHPRFHTSDHQSPASLDRRFRIGSGIAPSNPFTKWSRCHYGRIYSFSLVHEYDSTHGKITYAVFLTAVYGYHRHSQQ